MLPTFWRYILLPSSVSKWVRFCVSKVPGASVSLRVLETHTDIFQKVIHNTHFDVEDIGNMYRPDGGNTLKVCSVYTPQNCVVRKNNTLPNNVPCPEINILQKDWL